MKNKVRNVKHGFTLIEILVSALIAALLSTVLVVVLRSNLLTMSWGQKHMDFNYKIQFLMKQFYTDIKKINTHVVVGKYGAILLSGEGEGEFFPNIVSIEKDVENGLSGTELSFVQSSLRNLDNSQAIRYYPDKKNKQVLREVKSSNGKVRNEVVARNVTDLRFSKNENDPRSVRLTCRIFDDKRPDVFEDVDFTVRVEGDMIYVKVYE